MGTSLRVYKVFTKTGRGPWLRGDSALGPEGNKMHSTICIVLLSEFVSQNAWLHELTCPIKEKHKLIRENVLSVHTGVTCPPKLSLWAPNTKGHTKQANWLLDWVDLPYK